MDRDACGCALVHMLVAATETTDIGRSAAHIESNHGQIGLFAVSGDRITDDSARWPGKNGPGPIESDTQENVITRNNCFSTTIRSGICTHEFIGVNPPSLCMNSTFTSFNLSLKPEENPYKFDFIGFIQKIVCLQIIGIFFEEKYL